MRAVDVVAWSEALSVTEQELPLVLRMRAKSVEDLRGEMFRQASLLRAVPDDELVMRLMAGVRVLDEASSLLQDALRDVSRKAG